MTKDLSSSTIVESKYWKQAFIVLSLLIVVLMPYLSKDYGMTGDEWLQKEYGEDIWNYFKKGDQQALNYDARSLQYQKQELYGGWFDYTTTVLHHWFPSVEILTLRHFCNSIYGALMMIFTGLLAWKLSKKWSVGVIALLFTVFSPRIFGESMNNPKDIPFAAGFIIGIYFFVALLEDMPSKLWRNAIGLAIGFGIAFGVRSAGGILQLVYFVVIFLLYFLLNKSFKERLKQTALKRIAIVVGVALIVGYIIGLSCWPWGLQSPIDNPIESLKGMTNRETNIRVLFEGKYTWAHSLPWYYEFKWILISNPVIILVGIALFVLFIIQARKKYELQVPMLILFGALFPIVYMIYKHSTVYDSWRHVFFVYPFWAIAGAYGWDLLGNYIKDKRYNWVRVAIPVLGLSPAIIWTVRSHPFQSVYFNELVGGAKNAYGYYDLDYYQNSGKAAADWIKNNTKPIPGKKIIVKSNMSAYGLYFAKDTSWIMGDYGRYTERHHLVWDYYVAYPRYIPAELMQENKWLLQNTVHAVQIEGVPLCVVVKRQNTTGIDAYNAFQKKDYLTAVKKYAEFITNDTTDDYAFANYGIALASIGQVNPAIIAIKKAIQLDPSQLQYLQLLAEIYKAAGDMQNYQKIMMEAQNLSMQQQGDE